MATEETKPVEREAELLNACEHFLSIWPDPGPFALKEFVKLHRQASADAALERAAQVAESPKFSCKVYGCGTIISANIRALKGSR